MVEGKMMKVGTELRRIRAFSPINFPIKLSTDKRVRLPLRSRNVFRKGSRFDLNLKEKRKEGNILYFDSLEIYSSIKILSKVEEEIYIAWPLRSSIHPVPSRERCSNDEGEKEKGGSSS